MMPVIDQGQNDHNGLSVGKENMCHCDLSCCLENCFPWNFCNSQSLQTKGTSKYKWPNGQIQIRPSPSSRFKQLLLPRSLKLGQKVKAILKCALVVFIFGIMPSTYMEMRWECVRLDLPSKLLWLIMQIRFPSI